MEIQAGQHSDKGPRANNQDAVRVNLDLSYVSVADGMGGVAGGAEASRMALELTDWLLQRELAGARQGQSVPTLLAHVFREANRWIHRKGQTTAGLRGMGTTLVVLTVSDGRYQVAHAGDSRAYLLRGGELVQVTRDHSLVQARVDAGLIRAEDAMREPDRNIITRAVGVDPSLEAEIGEGEALGGDTFVLTTDGVHGVVPAVRIRELAALEPPQAAAESLVNEALRLQTTDNSTAAVLRAVGKPPPHGERAPLVEPGARPLSFLQRLRNLRR